MMTPRTSWVARWQHSTHLKPGMYAVSVIVPETAGDEDDLLDGEEAEDGEMMASDGGFAALHSGDDD